MFSQAESEPLHVDRFEYKIGSRGKALLRFGIWLVIILGILTLHYFLLHKVTEAALPLVILSWLCVLFWFWRFGGEHNDLPRWIDSLLKDSAYGTVAADGIRYRVVLRSRFLAWSSVTRVEYSPLDSGRLRVFMIGRHTFSQVRPLSFGPGAANSKASSEIEKILRDRKEEAKFLTTDQKSEKFFHL